MSAGLLFIFCCLWNQSTTCWHFKSISVLLCASSVSFVLLRCCCCCWLAAEHRNFNPFQLKIKSHFNTLLNTKSRSTSTWMNSLWSNEKWNFCFQVGIVLLFSNSISWLLLCCAEAPLPLLLVTSVGLERTIDVSQWTCIMRKSRGSFSTICDAASQ